MPLLHRLPYAENQSYDANSNPLIVRNRTATTTTLTYDELNRVKTKAPAGQPTVTYVYDLSGRQLSAATPTVAGDPSSGTFTNLFDTAGRHTTEQYPDGKQFVHQLDANGNIIRTTWPDSWYCERVFDQMNRLTDIKLNGAASSAVQYQYDALSRRKKIILENGTTTDYGFELDDDVNSIAQTFVGSNVTLSMGFNNNSELTSRQFSDNLFSWHPSAAGTTTYATANNVNQYPTVGGVSHSYNTAGCLTGDGIWTYTYSNENQLLTANKTGVSLAFKYDPYGRQVQKSVGALKTRFYYSGFQRMGDYDSNGVLLNRYIYSSQLDEVMIQVSSGGTKTYFHSDNLGSVIATTNSTGAVLNRYKYGPYGETSSLTGSSHGYTGQRFDPESGLYYYKFRYYSPTLGRFLQPDPIDVAGGLNLYAYCSNDPVNRTDSLGLLPIDYQKFMNKNKDIIDGWIQRGGLGFAQFMFINESRNRGLFDPKTYFVNRTSERSALQDFGNYQFGYLAAYLGLSLDVAKKGGGGYDISSKWLRRMNALDAVRSSDGFYHFFKELRTSGLVTPDELYNWRNNNGDNTADDQRAIELGWREGLALVKTRPSFNPIYKGYLGEEMGDGTMVAGDVMGGDAGLASVGSSTVVSNGIIVYGLGGMGGGDIIVIEEDHGSIGSGSMR